MKDFKFELFRTIGKGLSIKAFIRFNDDCKNGHQTFSITGEIKQGRRVEICGRIHDEIAQYIPELKPFIKWHLTSTDGPMHYLDNTLYHVEQCGFKSARSSAVWLNAKKEDITKDKLIARLPRLKKRFMKDMEKVKQFMK